MISLKVYLTKGYLRTTFKPSFTRFLPPFHRKNRNEHSLAEERCFFYHVNDWESLDALFFVSESVKKPIVITVGIEVILNHKIKIFVFFLIDKSQTNIAAFEIRVDFILHSIIDRLLWRLQLFKTLLIIVYKFVNASELTYITFLIALVAFKLIVQAFESFFIEIFLHRQVFPVYYF